MSNLNEMYSWVKEEFGGNPLVICPDVGVCQSTSPCYWVVDEREPGNVASRRIYWLVNHSKKISEAMGPASHTCPTFFFELVPTAESPSWRERVSWYASIANYPKSVQELMNRAYDLGECCHYSEGDTTNNPHLPGAPEYAAWLRGFEFAKRQKVR